MALKHQPAILLRKIAGYVDRAIENQRPPRSGCDTVSEVKISPQLAVIDIVFVFKALITGADRLLMIVTDKLPMFITVLIVREPVILGRFKNEVIISTGIGITVPIQLADLPGSRVGPLVDRDGVDRALIT
ncbi:hypothetical protein ACSX9W_03800 [Kosakonia cowanii]|uniref:hypothetical protein n=1 Tax=Kosakonia cowanii TaxID=208223 RepID=UPI003F69A503